METAWILPSLTGTNDQRLLPVMARVLLSESQMSPKSRMLSMTASSARPFSVRRYSTRGGISAKQDRVTTPASSRRRRRADNDLGLMPVRERWSSLKRRQPAARSRTIKGVQRSPIKVAVSATGQQALSLRAMEILWQEWIVTTGADRSSANPHDGSGATIARNVASGPARTFMNQRVRRDYLQGNRPQR